MEVGDILNNLGDPGIHYIILSLCLLVCSSTTAINHLLMTVWGYTPPFSCKNSENVTNSVDIISSVSSINITNSVKKCGPCSTNFNIYSGITNMSAAKCNLATKCTDWTFNLEGKETTVASEWSLVCDDKNMVLEATTIYFVGVMIGGALFGQLADKIGRKPVVLICMYGHILLGIGVYFVPNYIGFVALRFFVGFFVQGLQTASYVLLLEMTQFKYRPIIAGVYEIFWAIGNLWMSIVAWLVQDWRNIQLALCLPSLITLIYIPLVPESIRWLVSQGNNKTAEYHARRIASFNGVTLPDELNLFVSQVSKKKDGKEFSFHDLFRTPNMRKRTLILAYIWLASAIGYYGLSMSISGLAGDRFANKLISAFVEVFAFISVVIILKYMNRRVPLMSYFFIGGVACVVAGVVKNSTSIENAKVIATVLAFAGKFCVAAAFATVFLFTVELFPTVVRSIAFGYCVFWARVGGMVAPQIRKLDNYTSFKELPYLIIGCFSLVASLAIYFVPETHGKKLHDTIEELENFASTGEQAQTEVPGEELQLSGTNSEKILSVES